jgi:hypothetical protein
LFSVCGVEIMASQGSLTGGCFIINSVPATKSCRQRLILQKEGWESKSFGGFKRRVLVSLVVLRGDLG